MLFGAYLKMVSWTAWASLIAVHSRMVVLYTLVWSWAAVLSMSFIMSRLMTERALYLVSTMPFTFKAGLQYFLTMSMV